MTYYFVYLYGCNKIFPKPIYFSTNLEKIKKELAKNANCECFDDLLDKEKIIKFNKDYIDAEEKILNDVLISGPAHDSEIGYDYIIKKDEYTKILDKYKITYCDNSCYYGLTIFEINMNEKNILDMDKFEEMIWEFIY